MAGAENRLENSLERGMGVLGAISTVVAGTLGAGLFVTLGTAAETTGPSVVVVVALGGLLAMAIAINYSYLATIFPAAGSAYSFLSRTYANRFVGYVATWSKWLGYMAADAVLALGFGSYLQVFYPSVDPSAAGIGLLSVLLIVNLVGIRRYSISQTALFVLLCLSILVLVVPGSTAVHPEHYRPFFTGGIDGALGAAVPLFYAYIGVAVAGQIGAEVKNPGRTLPLAMIGGTAVLIVLYVWTAAVIYGVVADHTTLAESARPLATAADAFLPFDAVAVVAVGGLLATASSVHAVMAAGTRLPYAWAWDEIFPRWFVAVNDRWRTPHWSLVTLYAVATGLTLWTDGLDRVIGIAVFGYLVAYLAVSVTAGYVSLRRPELAERAAFGSTAGLLAPVTVASAGSFLLLTKAHEGALSILAPWLVVGLVVFLCFWYRGERSQIHVATILESLPGVPTDEYEPGVARHSPRTDDD